HSLKNRFFVMALSLAFIVIIGGCKHYDNFTTYFNTYYNESRLMGETEDDFEYADENKRIKPRLFVPQSTNFIPAIPKTGPPPFMEEFVIDDQKLQPDKVKLDSIIIKGSKILARHPKSNYIEGSLYLMAKAFFYRRDWINSQIKTSELIDRFPDGDLSPDAHLLMAKTYIIQRKFHLGSVLLSRCVDIAWQKKRYDILSEAFRIEAELALFQNDLDGALRPYLQAIAQCDDYSVKAKWQIDLAALYYRMNKFKIAERMFAKVQEYDPDYLGVFEAYLYQASCLARLGKFNDAEKIINSLDKDEKFKEWRANVYAVKLDMMRLQKQDSLFKKSEKFADSVYINNEAIAVVYFEKGMELFKQNKYVDARAYFARSRLQRTPVMNTSANLFKLINTWESRRNISIPLLQRRAKNEELNDSTNAKLALNLFELGRVHEQFGNNDSARIYYKISYEVAPKNDKETARYFYAFARFIEPKEPALADSMFDLVANNYPLTSYGRDAQKRLGYTDEFVIDTVAELYKSGSSLRKNGEYAFAISQFFKIYQVYPTSILAPKSLYSIGWTFEKNIKNTDSTLFYYTLLLQKYPQSDYAREIRPMIDYADDIKSGRAIPDSLKPKKLIKYVSNVDSIKKGVYSQQSSTTKPADNQKPDPLKILQNPGSMLNTITDPFKNSGENIKNTLQNTTDPDKAKDMVTPELKFKNPFEDFMKSSKPDTTKKVNPIPPK
ncbi:MAG: tetratricopeptide repeat protein, partial [FCB group bacterium]